MCVFCEAIGAGGDAGFAATGVEAAPAPESAALSSLQIAALVAGTQYNRWNANAALGTGAFVTYSFDQAVPAYDSAAARAGFAAFTGTQQANARLALAAWSAVCGVTFLEVPDATGGQVRFGMHDFSLTPSNAGSAGYAYYPSVSGTSVSDIGGDVWVASNLYGTDTLGAGTYGYTVLLHEIGHAIGLKHPFEGTIRLPTAEDNRTNTVMSYTGGTVSSLGLYDLAAAQYLYGASSIPSFWDAPNLTLTLYGSDAAQTFVAPSLNSIVSAAGGDDVVVGGSGNDWLFGGDGADNVTGGAGNDVLYGDTFAVETGNDLLDGGIGNDILIGGNGADSLTGGAGDDWLFGSDGADGGFGGDGNDVFYGDLFAGEVGNDLGEGGRGNDVLIGGAGDDALYGGFANGVFESGSDWLFGSDGNDALYGGGGDDVLYGDLFDGEAGNDQLLGGEGNDFLWGGAGNDVLTGGTGTDNLFGGDGGDIFRFGSIGDLSNDVINDFAPTQDVLDLRGVLGAGATFASLTAANLRQAGTSVVLDFDGAGNTYQVVLLNVAVTSLNAGNLLV